MFVTAFIYSIDHLLILSAFLLNFICRWNFKEFLLMRRKNVNIWFENGKVIIIHLGSENRGKDSISFIKSYTFTVIYPTLYSMPHVF